MPRSAPRRAAAASARRHILVLHGPNLNLLGERQPEHYGRTTLAQIVTELEARATRAGVTMASYQSNSEGALIDAIQAARTSADAIVINPAAYTHTSIAIRDALLAAGLPAFEVHLSNVHKREAFRRQSLISDVCVGQVVGFGALSYSLAFDAAVAHLTRTRPE